MTEGVLDRIVRTKHAELARRFDGVALDALRAAAQPTLRSLSAAIARPGARSILEIKKASPSQGSIRADADPRQLAAGYDGVADALSVLTDGSFFGGSLDDLKHARTAFRGPILAKDFFVDPRQVAEARIAGADAILVMLSVLDDAQAMRMVEEAVRLGMDALVEVHSLAEMRRALRLPVRVIGINNRNLGDLSVDLSVTERLAPLAPDRLLVAESGIDRRADIDRLAPQVDAFLIGTSLMRAPCPAQAARKLLFGRVKLCGLNRLEDFEAAGPATYAGLVFVPMSPRALTRDEASPLAERARAHGIAPVGIFRDAPVPAVAAAAAELGLEAVQLHGSEPIDYVQQLRRALPPACEIWTAIDASQSTQAPERGGDRLLFDNRDGGSGQQFDWSLVRAHPRLSASLLAGGIGPHNARAARSVGAHAIDVGSALDAVPGRKSPARIEALFDALRAPSRQKVRECA